MEPDRRADVDALTAAAARFGELAEVADLMDDPAGAQRLRDLAEQRYAEAMAVLDADD